MENIKEECLKLPKRENSNTSSNFGVEIECGILDIEDLSKLEEIPKMHIGSDVSIKSGISTEITSDVLLPNSNDLEILKSLSNTLKKIPMTFDGCSFQVSIDSDLSKRELFNFLLLVSVYEKVIYRFSLGKDKALRNSVSEYAGSLRLYLKELIKRGSTIDNIVDNLIGVKSWIVGFKCERDKYFKFTGPVNHVEFRSPNSCIDYELWMNYINTFTNMIMASKNVDTERLLSILDNMNYIMSYDSTAFINMDKALEFADLIFKDDIDKLYFYKQYLGLYKYEDEQVVKIIN